MLLRLPWAHRKKLPESDADLYHAYSIYKANLCGCGCGQWAKESHDPLSTGDYVVDDSIVCNAGAALTEWQKSSAEHAEAGTIPVVKRAADMAAEQMEKLAKEREKRRANASKNRGGPTVGDGGLV